MIEVKQVTKIYDQSPVLNEIDVCLPEEKIISFIGSNGTGKSTLLSIIGRTLEKNGGQVYIDEIELSLWKSQELAKHLSILQQAQQSIVRLSVEELVEFGRFPHSQGRLSKEDQQHIDRAIAYLELDHLRTRYLDELSGGQRQLAYIAMVLAQDSHYIFLDEPLNNLDMKHATQIMKVLRKLVDELHKTVLVVIHDINFVSYYSDHIIALKEGKIIAQGSTDEIIRPEVLKEIYDIEMTIKEIDGKRFCLYFE